MAYRRELPHLRARRLRLQASQRAIACEACVDQKTICHAEQGRTVNGSTAALIEDALARLERRTLGERG